MADATLVIKLITDATQAQKGFAAAESRMGKTQRTLGKMAAPAAGAILAIGAFGKAAFDAASRTEQAIGAVDSVFGKNAGTVKKWANSAATDVGLAKSEYLELASVMGAQLKNMGVPLDQVAGKTNDLVKLGSDLAATYGGTTKEAVEALGSALRGETDPIERYGVSVKQADIAAQQAKDGTDKLTGAAGKQAKTMALLSLVNKQTADAQGQFARESDSAAGSAQITAARYEDLKSTLGTALLPIITSVITVIGRLTAVMAKHQTTTKVIIAVIALLAAGILALNVALGIYTAVTTLAASATVAAWVAAAWPILAVVAAVALVVGAFVLLYKKSATVRAIVDKVWAGLKAGARAAATVIKLVFRVAWAAVSAYVRTYAAIVRAVFTVIRTVAVAVARTLKTVFSAVWSALKTGARGVQATINAVWGAIRSTARTVTSAIRTAWSTTWGALKSGVKGLGAILSAPFDAVKSAINTVIGLVEDLIRALGRIKVPKISLPKIPGMSRSAAPAMAAPAVGGYAAPTGRSGRAVATSSTTSGGITINVSGAIDPESTARQIRRILSGHDRRVGLR